MKPIFLTVPHSHWQYARAMRKEPTRAEARLWRELRCRRSGVRFQRQHPFGPYIPDFYCWERRLIIEIDGATHGTPEEIAADRMRDDYFRAQGFRVLRFSNAVIFRRLPQVLREVRSLIDAFDADGADPVRVAAP